MTGEAIRDLGSGVYVRLTTCSHSPEEWSGAIVGFGELADDPMKIPAGNCEGAISWCSECAGPTWELISLDPLEVAPSVACKTHGEHHGFIRGGRWQWA